MQNIKQKKGSAKTVRFWYLQTQNDYAHNHGQRE